MKTTSRAVAAGGGSYPGGHIRMGTYCVNCDRQLYGADVATHRRLGHTLLRDAPAALQSGRMKLARVFAAVKNRR